MEDFGVSVESLLIRHGKDIIGNQIFLISFIKNTDKNNKIIIVILLVMTYSDLKTFLSMFGIDWY